VSDNIYIKPEPKASPNLRKLARALLLLAEEKAQAAKQAAEKQWAEQHGPESDPEKESAA
jgi:hypothetical protein